MRIIIALALCVFSLSVMANSSHMTDMSMMHPEMNKPIVGVNFDYLEWQKNPDTADVYHWDFTAEVLSGNHRFELVSEGKANNDATDESLLQAIYRRGFSPFWDWQLGVQSTIEPFQQDSVLFGVVGVMPYYIELDSYVLLADGAASWHVKLDYELLVTQNMQLMLDSETTFYAQNNAAFLQGAGLSSMKNGVRLAFKHWLAGAPYIGMQWHRSFGNTAAYNDAAQLPNQEWVAVMGLTLHY